ncbi:SH3 domain-binding glutamic acid-rich protein homolog [Ctenocephalides felis]|uniref:SH3 domain-binding glutamic acid-rich protein homolog n=1 Tax=Ctenocephalides felis TaxID=7515 RepID=UPI000E6E11EB|nr:SH3 domain-binding glutamic acid-rich protein homolog [Ctenocephalides felis]
MVVKVYVSGLSGNKEVKKRQQRVLMILDSKTIKYEVIDITEPANEDQRDFMRDNCVNNSGDNNVNSEKTKTKCVPLPPQIFNDETYCGDYDGFDIANEIDKLEEFLKLERIESEFNGERISKQEEINNKQNEVNSAVSDVIDKIGMNNIDEDFNEKNGTEHEEATEEKSEENIENTKEDDKEEKIVEEKLDDNSRKDEEEEEEEEEEAEEEEEE